MTALHPGGIPWIEPAAMTSPIVTEYMRQFGKLSPDPLCPELRAWNTARLHDLWVLTGGNDGRAPIPFWGIVWPGARALARYILDNSVDFAGRRVLDIGTGSGIAAIAAAKAGADVTGMDVDPAAIEMAVKTARANRVTCRWIAGDALRITDDDLSCYDVIIAGDVFYEERFAEGITGVLRNARRAGLRNIAADVGRTFRPRTGVRVLCSMRIPVYREIEGIDYRDTNIITLAAE